MKKLILLVMFLVTGVFATVDINTASVKELMTLSGIGKVKAEAIVNYRKAHKFKNINELTKVKGIGNKLLLKLKKQLKVSNTNMNSKKQKAIKNIKKFKKNK